MIMSKVISISIIFLVIILTTASFFFFYERKIDDQYNENMIEFSRTFSRKNNDLGHSVFQTADGGYLITGDTRSPYYGLLNNILLIKTDYLGYEEWNRTYGGTCQAVINSIVDCSDGGYIITGKIHCLPSYYYDLWLIRIDDDGNEIWNLTFDFGEPDIGIYTLELYDGSFITTGSKAEELFLIKVKENGSIEWNRTYIYDGDCEGHFIKQNDEGDFIIVGTKYTWGEMGNEILMVKTDKTGNEIWNKTFGSIDDCISISIKNTEYNGFIILNNICYGETDKRDIQITKIDETGNVQWSKIYFGKVGNSIQQNPDDTYLVVGTIENIFSDKSGIYVFKIDGKGNEVWNITFDQIYGNHGKSIITTSDGGYVILGDIQSNSNKDYDIIMIKTKISV